MSAVLLIGLGAQGAGAQYNSPVGKEANESIPAKSSLEEAYENARWVAGPFRIQPWIGLRDASTVRVQTVVDDDTIEETDDFTATAGAGIRAYARTSPKLIFAAHALPEYTWWQDNDAKSVVNGRYGAGLFGFFNRLKLEASIRRKERQDIFSTEVRQLTSLREDLSNLGFELEVARGVDVWVRGESKEIGNNEDDSATFGALNRSEDTVSVGVQLHSQRGYKVRLGYKDLSADFDSGSRNLSNEGSSILLALGYESGRMTFTADFEQIDLEPVGDSALEPFDELIGQVEATWKATNKLEFLLYGHRGSSYSVSSGNSHLVSDRLGLSTRLKGARSSAELTYAVGEDAYEARGAGPDRTDDVTELRASFRVPMGDLLALTFYGLSLDYDSNADGLDRDFSTYGVSVDLGRLAERFSFGKNEGVW